jgi:hypothetical protein
MPRSVIKRDHQASRMSRRAGAARPATPAGGPVGAARMMRPLTTVPPPARFGVSAPARRLGNCGRRCVGEWDGGDDG